MRVENNKALVQRFLDEVVNGGNLDAIPQGHRLLFPALTQLMKAPRGGVWHSAVLCAL